MRVQSVVRQNLVPALVVFSLVIMAGLLIGYIGRSDLAAGSNFVVIGLGVLLALMGLAAVVATAVSIALVAELGPAGVSSR